jgi:hypothetical protein
MYAYIMLFLEVGVMTAQCCMHCDSASRITLKEGKYVSLSSEEVFL